MKYGYFDDVNREYVITTPREFDTKLFRNNIQSQ